MRMRVFLGRMSVYSGMLIALSATAQDEIASDERAGNWQIVQRYRSQDVFAEPVRSSQDLCRTVAAKSVPLNWDGGEFPEDVWFQDYFAVSSEDCVELGATSYKFMADPIEEKSLVRLLRNLEPIVSGLPDEARSEFERYFGRGGTPSERLTIDTLAGVGISDFDPRFLGASKYELYFQGPDMYFIVYAESDGAGFRAVTVSTLID